MRTIKFRGKTEDGNWVFGDLLTNHVTPEILAYKGQYAVEKDTVGQFTGLLDKNDEEIYEGDILMVTQGAMKGFRAYVEWRVDFAEWELKSKRRQMAISQNIVKGYGMKIVGNIHDNPKFLEEIK